MKYLITSGFTFILLGETETGQGCFVVFVSYSTQAQENNYGLFQSTYWPKHVRDKADR